ncbi:MAG: cupin domain-containing protein [Chitinophagaceae bacterium]
MKNTRRIIVFSAILFTSFFVTNTFAQSDPHAAMHAPVAKSSNTRLIDKALTDSGLVNKRYRVNEYIMAPGQADTIAHRHGAEVFIYVIEGTIQHRLGNDQPITYTKGQVLHEPPYSLHVFTKNLSATEPAKLLITFLYTEGVDAPKFIREYPVKK